MQERLQDPYQQAEVQGQLRQKEGRMRQGLQGQIQELSRRRSNGLFIFQWKIQTAVSEDRLCPKFMNYV